MADLTRALPYRTPLRLVNHPIENALPSHFVEAYPNLINFLHAYYDQLDQPDTPESTLHQLFNLNDLSTIEPQFLVFLEQQFLLGRTNFEASQDKRAALKVNHSLYESKGSKFSLEQFFRMFFDVDAEVVYTKRNVFQVGKSEIGPDSLQYITNDKLYQTFALLIKTSISIDKWKDSYKLFVHPAGMYLGAELLIVTAAPEGRGLCDGLMPEATANKGDLEIEGWNEPELISQPSFADITGIVPLRGGAEGEIYRIGFVNTTEFYAETTIPNVDKQYDNIEELMTATSPTMDNDDESEDGVVGPRSGTIGMSNTHETMDQDKYEKPL